MECGWLFNLDRRATCFGGGESAQLGSAKKFIANPRHGQAELLLTYPQFGAVSVVAWQISLTAC